jgi:carboxylesterase type B
LYDGTNFVTQGNVVLVTVNYRLGVLGFMVDPSRDIHGNYAIQDQRMALRWIQSNIGNFGGDANSVTLFGESAGAACTTAHIISPLSTGLFHRVIVQSNPWSIPFLDVTLASDLGNKFAKVANCANDKSNNCIKGLSWQDIVEYQDKASNVFYWRHPLVTFMPFTPVIDGIELPKGPLDAFATGNFQKINMMMGTCAEEARM